MRHLSEGGARFYLKHKGEGGRGKGEESAWTSDARIGMGASMRPTVAGGGAADLLSFALRGRNRATEDPRDQDAEWRQ